MSALTQLPSWQALEAHHEQIATLHLRDLFAQDRTRGETFSLEAANIFLDYSRQPITTETLQLLYQLAKECKLENKIKDLISGKPVNTTENRAALHTRLRDPQAPQEIQEALQKVADISDALRQKTWLGCTNKFITDVVNIGVGGSDLGPMVACEALKPFKNTHINCHFVSNIDSASLQDALNKLDPETTVFIVASKSFSTPETLQNASSAKEWLLNELPDVALSQHFIAITENQASAKQFGISVRNILPLWEWIGGRYSLWSCIGLTLAVQIGMENFRQLLAGAHAMDEHFTQAPLEKNMPVIMALTGIWLINFFNIKSHAIVPYSHYMRLLPMYLQQLAMESNGKGVTIDGEQTDYSTAPIVWGGQGSNAQHSFHQLFHQGHNTPSIDFVLPLKSHHNMPQHHECLLANCLAQSHVLMTGKQQEEILDELIAQGLSSSEAKKLAPHKSLPGNKPSNILLMPKITPYSLGALIALYEHKTFVQGVIWRINSFDQWGVEHGKQIAQTILHALENDTVSLPYEMEHLIKKYKLTT